MNTLGDWPREKDIPLFVRSILFFSLPTQTNEINHRAHLPSFLLSPSPLRRIVQAELAALYLPNIAQALQYRCKLPSWDMDVLGFDLMLGRINRSPSLSSFARTHPLAQMFLEAAIESALRELPKTEEISGSPYSGMVSLQTLLAERGCSGSDSHPPLSFSLFLSFHQLRNVPSQ